MLSAGRAVDVHRDPDLWRVARCEDNQVARRARVGAGRLDITGVEAAHHIREVRGVLKLAFRLARPTASHFGPNHFDYRLATVLHAIASMETCDAALEADAGPCRWPAAMKDVLTELAERPLNEHEQGLKQLGERASCLGWEGPYSIPELAQWALARLPLTPSRRS